MNPAEIADKFSEFATLLELSGANTFRVRAIRNAERVVSNYSGSTEKLLEEALSGKIKGIGAGISADIKNLTEKGKLEPLENLKKELPDGLFKILKIQGLGPKKVRALWQQLDVEEVSKLKEVCESGEIETLKGFSKKTSDNILTGIENLEKFSSQFLFRGAFLEALELEEYLKKSKFFDELQVAGSLRRLKETVKDVDFIASSKKPEELMEHFVSYPSAISVSSKGSTKAGIILESGLGVDLRVVSRENFYSALLHFTGSKEHNTQLRTISKSWGYKLSEYGLEELDSKVKKPKIKKTNFKSEEEVYNALELSFVPPPLRENLGEVESASQNFKAKKKFPKYLERKDIKGVIHAHSTYSDGKNTLEEMATATKEKGFEYLVISDHSQTASYAGGLKPKDILKQHKEIDKLNKKLAPFKIFKSIESDILTDGSLDYEEEVLKSFDLIIASVHSSFNLPEKEMTERLIKAIENPYTTILGHATGRLLLKRDPYSLNITAVLEAAAKHNVAIELNANPRRLDLDWRYLREAFKLGVLTSINPDAHSIEGIDNIIYGVNVSIKAEANKKNVLSAFSLKEFEKFLQKRQA